MLRQTLDLPIPFAAGSFLLPADEVLGGYPWPTEENVIDAVFARHASPCALLKTYHELGRVLV